MRGQIHSSDRIPSWERAPGTYWIGCWLGQCEP